MSLTSKLNKAATIAPLALALVSTTVAAQEKLQVIEPKSADLSKPIEGCVETTSDATAWNKLVTVMNARKQMIVASGDKLVVGGKQEMMFTISNNFSGKEGYIVYSTVPKTERISAKELCFRPTASAAFVDISNLDAVPKVVNQGELGIALINNHNLGSKVAVMGVYDQGSLYAVHFNPKTGKGAYKAADSQGGRTRDLAIFENFDYSAKMKQVFESLSSQKPNEISNSTNAPSTAAPQLKP